LGGDARQGAIDALVSDLYWQIDQLKPRGIKINVGQPYNPSITSAGCNKGRSRVAAYAPAD